MILRGSKVISEISATPEKTAILGKNIKELAIKNHLLENTQEITKKWYQELLYKLCKKYIRFMWPIARFINRLPRGRTINWMLLIADYRGAYELPEKILKEWAILDTFDMLSPAYDQPQRLIEVRDWFKQAGLRDVEINYCRYNSLRGRK